MVAHLIYTANRGEGPRLKIEDFFPPAKKYADIAKALNLKRAKRAIRGGRGLNR